MSVDRMKLSDRIGPQDNVTVPFAAPASFGASTTSDPTSHAVLVEEIQDVACTVKNTGANALAALAPGQQQTVPIQGNVHRWMRLVGQNTVADGPVSIAWTGQ